MKVETRTETCLFDNNRKHFWRPKVRIMEPFDTNYKEYCVCFHLVAKTKATSVGTIKFKLEK